jgi:hypothetical protein
LAAMSNFLLAQSMRYTTWQTVYACTIHVIEFHQAFVGVTPPPFPMARWLLKRLKRLMIQEKPEGRRLRPGLRRTEVEAILRRVWAAAQASADKRLKRLYVNFGAAVSVCFEKALRMGEVCPGDHFNPVIH